MGVEGLDFFMICIRLIIFYILIDILLKSETKR